MTKNEREILYNYFSDDDFLRISNKIKEMEKITRGEIRVAIKPVKPSGGKSKSPEELAHDEFTKLGMTETVNKTGILIYIILAERQFYIMADSGINEKVEQSTWDEVRDEMQSKFRVGHFDEGITHGVERVGNILSKHFPTDDANFNELSNKVEF